MKKLQLVKLFVLLLAMALLAGCIMPPGFGQHHGGGHDNGHHAGKHGH
jgi:predicted small secreted protein